MARPRKDGNRKRRGRFEGGLRKNSSGLWEASLSLGRKPDGKRNRITVTGKTKKEALDKLAELKQQPAIAGDNITIGSYAKQWLKGKRQLADATVTRYDTLIRLHITPYLGHILVKDLAELQVESWLDEMQAGGTSVNNQASARHLLSTIYKAAIKLKITTHNPVQNVEGPRVPKRESYVLTLEEIDAFLKAGERDRLHAMWCLIVATACRVGEALCLEWSDIDFDSGVVSITKTQSIKGKRQLIVKEPKTASSNRKVKLADFALEALRDRQRERLIEGLSGCPLVWPTKPGKMMWLPNCHEYHFKPTLKRAGLPSNVRIHDLRHSTGSWLVAQGTPIKEVSEILGHQSVEFTLSVYIHTMEQAKAEAVERFGKSLGR